MPQSVKRLGEDLQKARNSLTQKRKFVLKRPPPPATLPGVTADGKARKSTQDIARLAQPDNGELGFQVQNLKAKVLVLDRQHHPSASSGAISNVSESLVDIQRLGVSGPGVAGLMVLNIDQSILIYGRVAGASHVTGVTKSLLLVNSQQLRMHHCHDSTIYLNCQSRPIIEDCSGLKFASLPPLSDRSSGPNIGATNDPSEADKTDHDPAPDRERNFWDQIDDFNWIKEGPSPNWTVLTTGEAGLLAPEDLSVLTDPQTLTEVLEAFWHRRKQSFPM